MRRFAAIIVGILVIVALFFGIRSLMTHSHPPIKKYRSEGIPNLDEAIKRKLQELVADGSDGLYRLSIGRITPNIIGMQISATDIVLAVDTPGYRRLQQMRELPNDIFYITCRQVHIDGINIDDFIFNKSAAAGRLSIIAPSIVVCHQRQQEGHADTSAALPLYKRILHNMEKISVDEIALDSGTFIDYNASSQRSDSIKSISIRMDDVLIDSATQYDRHRFLFARQAGLSVKDYSFLSKDSLYLFKAGNIAIDGPTHNVTIRDAEMIPRGGKKEFERRHKTRATMYQIRIDTLRVNGLDWWAAIHSESIIATSAQIAGGNVYIYYDRTLPKSGGITIANFPQQLIEKAKFPFSIPLLKVSGMNIAYEEFNPEIKRGGTITFNQLSGTMTNVTDIPAEVKAAPAITVNATCTFLSSTPMTGKFVFFLAPQKQGGFVADVTIGGLSHTDVNKFSEPMALVGAEDGEVSSATAHAEGDNNIIKGWVTANYTDLKIKLLKKESRTGRLKEHVVFDALTNTFVIRKNNPRPSGQIKRHEFSLKRDHCPNFFNFLWSAVKKGLLKMIGIPPEVDDL